MPVTQSAKKRLRQDQKRRQRNLAVKRRMREQLKAIRRLVAEQKTAKAQELLPGAYKVLDKAAKERVIKKNTASRKKSRLAKLIAKPSRPQP